MDKKLNFKNYFYEESVNVHDAHYDAQNHSDGSMSVKKVLGKPRLIMKSYHKEKDGHSFAKKHGYKVNNFTKTMSGTRMDLHNMNESVDEAQIDKMKYISKGFMGRKEAERHNDKLVGSGKASNKSYVHDHKDGKFYVVDVKESIEVDEVFTPQMRRAAARRMKILAPRIKLGLKRSKNRTATKEKLMNRAVRSVKDTLIKKFTKGKSKTELSPARRAEMEKRIKKLGPRIKRLAMKQLPATRQLERDRKQARAK